MTGHKLLIKYINNLNKNLNDKVILEIGSTREFLPGHNSSEEFILLCKKNNMKFISVDMDPECSQNVINISKKHNFTNYEVHTMKGEEYLEQYNSTIDFIYLDAFDFYHGGHSKKRQEAYSNYLNCSIDKDDKLCHDMHLQCCKNIISKCNKETLICFDDILDNNKRGKGVTAIPYLLENNFKILEYNQGLHSMILTL